MDKFHSSFTGVKVKEVVENLLKEFPADVEHFAAHVQSHY